MAEVETLDLTCWDVSGATNFYNMFKDLDDFNGNLGEWDMRGFSKWFMENVGGNGTRVSGEHTVAKNECRQLRKGQTVVFGRPGHPTEFAYTVHRAAAAPAAIELRLRGDVPTAPRRIVRRT